MITTMRRLALLALLGSGAAMATPTVYQHCDFSGYGASLSPGSYDLPALRRMGIQNDDLSSVHVGPGFEVVLYEHAGFRGRSLVRTANDKCFTNEGFNDIVSSIKVRRVASSTGQPRSGAVVNQHCDFGGYGVRLGEGRYDLGQLNRLGMRNDDISALKVARGFRVTLYQHAGFRGRQLVKTANDACLVNDRFNDIVSSITVERIRNTPPPTTQTIEQRCFARVQDRVAWNRAGEKRWQPNNIRDLCRGVRNITTRISCFKRGIREHGGWNRAIKACNGTTPPAPPQPPQPPVQTIEERCYDRVQDRVAWNRAGKKHWQDNNVRELCRGVRNINTRISCFQRGIRNHGKWNRAIKECNGTAPTPTPPTPTKTPEERCYDRVQNRVAWNRAGEKRWDARNVRELCSGVRNVERRITCFKRGIRNHGEWRRAINVCNGSAPTPTPPPPPASSAPVLKQAAYQPGTTTYRYGHNSIPRMELSNAPRDADCSRYATLHDGNMYRAYCFKRGTRDKLYQFGFNRSTNKYEFGYRSIAELRITGIPGDARSSQIAMLHDGSVYRLYMLSRDGNSLYQFGFNPRTNNYEYGHRSIRNMRITGKPADAGRRFGMLHDGSAYRLYLRSRSDANKVYQFAFNRSSNAYEFGHRSIRVLNVAGMSLNPDFSMLHDGSAYRMYNMRP